MKRFRVKLCEPNDTNAEKRQAALYKLLRRQGFVNSGIDTDGFEVWIQESKPKRKPPLPSWVGPKFGSHLGAADARKVWRKFVQANRAA